MSGCGEATVLNKAVTAINTACSKHPGHQGSGKKKYTFGACSLCHEGIQITSENLDNYDEVAFSLVVVML